jgi:hypothetical protein
MGDWAECQAMHAYRREGIGLHGGGSGLPNPMASHQSPPFVVTHGCLRLVNFDLEAVVKKVQASQKRGGMAYITVEEPVPGAPTAEAEDDYLDVPVEELAPGE